MAHENGHKEWRCWACGRVIEEPIRGLCFECYSRLRQPGEMGRALMEGPASTPPFVALRGDLDADLDGPAPLPS